MATAVYAKTESADDYLFCSNHDLNPEQVQALLKEELGEEYEYVSHYMVTVSET